MADRYSKSANVVFIPMGNCMFLPTQEVSYTPCSCLKPGASGVNTHTGIIYSYKREEERDQSYSVLPSCEGQYCVFTYPQMSGLITTTTATTCYAALQGCYCGHTPGY